MPEAILALPKPYKSGLILTEEDDPRYLQVVKFRRRAEDTLHLAASAMRNAGESDNSVETVKLLVATIGTLLTSYGIRSKQFAQAQVVYGTTMSTKRLFESQRKFQRSIFISAASVHHQNRLANLAYYRIRSARNDKLIKNMLDFCLSPFMRIRRSAQSTLETISKLYRGTWILCFPTLFDALQPGSDPDRMKGALYVLRYNQVGISRISRYWRQLPELVYCLLNAHHETKASVQALVTKASDELIASIKEPTNFPTDVGTDAVDAAADILMKVSEHRPSQQVVIALRQAMQDSRAETDREWNLFVNKVLELAANPALNWRYVLSASRFLYAVCRRDRPTDTRQAGFFLELLQDPHPRIRDYGISGTTRLLFHVALRSLCQGSDERLFLEEPVDKFVTEIPLTDTSASFTSTYLAQFREPVPKDETTMKLVDRLQSGWLAWGKTIEVSRMSGWDEQAWTLDQSCEPGLQTVREVVFALGFWEGVSDEIGNSLMLDRSALVSGGTEELSRCQSH